MPDTFDPDIPYSERSLAIACTRGRHAIVTQFNELLAEAHLTEQQWRVLRVISDYGPVALSEVCQRSCIHKVSMTRIIRALTERGYIESKRNTEDLRAYNVELTPSGHEFLEQMKPRANRISRDIVERFGAEKSAQLLSLLKELAALKAD
ncbi:MarR family transcriptional regulator [Roseobacter sp. N2S]|jgi:homoprotocatechuate degradation regulator HpaR|uniref:MarR family transcriptional regulator n=1 Tax=Roseobacter sp. N2S TaxID=2663844 RepID=UPI000DF43B49|nr:MarR family transcriptional regulator [Roseobacter sp. N2S]MDR6267478.1 homoprotocatechuate degradation regulator HpaR [Roseobacter sp. N2S]|tara:strand:- start:112 stop:561 length:450 start_codon:yes stop_codon:yes gene_type:complete